METLYQRRLVSLRMVGSLAENGIAMAAISVDGTQVELNLVYFWVIVCERQR
jgi:hypothetical protein